MNDTVHALGDIQAAMPLQLDDLLATIWSPARSSTRARRIGDSTKLPLALEQCIRRLSPGDLWRAYGDGVHGWFVTARTVEPDSPDPSAIGLELHVFENDGAACAAGIWQRSSDTDWNLDAVLDSLPGNRLSTGIERRVPSPI